MKKAILIFVIAVVLSSCSTTYKIPLASENNEVKANLEMPNDTELVLLGLQRVIHENRFNNSSLRLCPNWEPPICRAVFPSKAED